MMYRGDYYIVFEALEHAKNIAKKFGKKLEKIGKFQAINISGKVCKE